MIDLNEILKKLKAEIPDEIKGIKEYSELSKAARENNHDEWAGMLWDMAHEEYTHAKHIMYILDKNNISYSEYIQPYNDAKNIMDNI